MHNAAAIARGHSIHTEGLYTCVNTAMCRSIRRGGQEYGSYLLAQNSLLSLHPTLDKNPENNQVALDTLW